MWEKRRRRWRWRWQWRREQASESGFGSGFGQVAKRRTDAQSKTQETSLEMISKQTQFGGLPAL